MIDEVPVRQPRPKAMLTVHALRQLRQGVAELAAANEAVLLKARREQRIRDLCHRNWDLALARQIMSILDGSPW